jgi:hypothetical protein
MRMAALVGLREFGCVRGRCFVPFAECNLLEKLFNISKMIKLYVKL